MMGLAAVSGWWPRGQCLMDIEYGGGTRGAAVKANYFNEWYDQVARDGLRSANVHVSGNDSHSRLISLLERIDQANPGSVRGWAMDHCTLIEPEDVPRAAKLGLMWSCSPLGEGDRAPMIAAAFGDKVAHTYVAPIKSMLDAGMNVSLEGEWAGVENLITRKDTQGRECGDLSKGWTAKRLSGSPPRTGLTMSSRGTGSAPSSPENWPTWWCSIVTT